MTIKVLIADDHPVVRKLFRRQLETAGDIEIVAMASSGEEAVAHALLHCPDVAIIDISMPSMDGIEATRQIRAHCSQTRVLIVSIDPTPESIQKSLKAGAEGYVLKELAANDLSIGVHSLYDGKSYFSKPIAEIAKRFI